MAEGLAVGNNPADAVSRVAVEVTRAVTAQRRAQQICARALTASAIVEGTRTANAARRDVRLAQRDARQQVRRLETQVSNLEIALERRGVIEQAKGILMSRLGCGPDDAFAVLTKVSQTHHRKLHDVAAAVVADRVANVGRGERARH